MTTMNISLPDDMKSFVDEQVHKRQFMSSSEYIRDLIRREKEIEEFRKSIMDSEPTPISAFDDAYFSSLRARVEKHG